MRIGEQTDYLGHGGLKEAAVRTMRKAVRWESVAV